MLGSTNKQPLVLIHGFGASSSHWRSNADFFVQKGFRVYALDLIGFGKSEQPGPNKIKKLDNYFWSMQIAAFLQNIVETHKNGKAILLGNSLGALTAITTAAFYPELVGPVIAEPLPDPALINSNNFKSPHWFLLIKKNLLNIFFRLFPLELLIPLIVKSNLINLALQAAYYNSIKKDNELKRIVSEPAKRNSAPRALRAMCIGMATRNKEHTAPFLLDRINSMPNHSPILLAWGREDKFVPLRIGQGLKNQYPWLDLFILENTGHCPHDESSRNFNNYILNWLKNHLEGYIQ